VALFDVRGVLRRESGVFGGISPCRAKTGGRGGADGLWNRMGLDGCMDAWMGSLLRARRRAESVGDIPLLIVFDSLD